MFHNGRLTFDMNSELLRDDYHTQAALEKRLDEAARAVDPPIPYKKAEKTSIKREQQEDKEAMPTRESVLRDLREMEEINAHKQSKPTDIPYYGLVYLAFINADGDPLTVQQMYAFVLKVWPSFADLGGDWQGAIRNQLVTHKSAFVQVGQKDGNVQYKLDMENVSIVQKKLDKFLAKHEDAKVRGLQLKYTWDDLINGRVGIPSVEWYRRKKDEPKKNHKKHEVYSVPSKKERNEYKRGRTAKEEDDEDEDDEETINPFLMDDEYEGKVVSWNGRSSLEDLEKFCAPVGYDQKKLEGIRKSPNITPKQEEFVNSLPKDVPDVTRCYKLPPGPSKYSPTLYYLVPGRNVLG